MDKRLSDRSTQIDIEKEMLKYLEGKHPDWQRVSWRETAGALAMAKTVRPDGVWKDGEGRTIIAECYARVGRLQPSHRRKLATDTLKLISLQTEFGDTLQLRLLLVVPEELAVQLEDNDWLAVVIRKELEVARVPLTDEQRQRLAAAVKREGEGQVRRRRAG